MRKLLSSLFLAGLMFGAVAGAGAVTLSYQTDVGAGFLTDQFNLFGAKSELDTFRALNGSVDASTPNNINVSTYNALSNATTTADNASIPFQYTVRVWNGADFGTDFGGDPNDFVDFTLKAHIDAVNYKVGSGTGSLLLGAGDLGFSGVLTGFTADTNTKVTLKFVSFDNVDAIQKVPGFGNSFILYQGQSSVNGNIGSMTFELASVPEPGSVAMLLGMSVPCLLLTSRRLRSKK